MLSTSSLIKELHLIRNNFDPSAIKRKEQIVEQLKLPQTLKSKDLYQLCEILLFLSAHPHSGSFLKSITRLQQLLPEGIRMRIRKDKSEGVFENTGLKHTHVKACFSFELVTWLVEQYPSAVALDSFGAETELLFTLLQPMLPTPLREHFYEGGYNNIEEWLEAIAGSNRAHQLILITELYKTSEMPHAIRNQHFDQMEMYIDCDMGIIPSRSELKGPHHPVFFHTEALIRKADLAGLLAGDPPVSVALQKQEKQGLLRTMRLQLLTLYRETDPVTYADINDIHTFDVGRGMYIVLTGMDSIHRSPLDAYIGFMAFKNTLPYAYGVAWMLGDMAKIGINIFPSYRGGESAWFFAQLLHVYYKQFKPRCFIAEPYQVGRDNPEGLETGAFWFYYRLGFRPIQARLQEMAKREFLRIQKIKGHKTPVRILQQLVADEMILIMGTENSVLNTKYDTAMLSAALTQYIHQRYKGNLTRATEEATAALCASLRISDDVIFEKLKPAIERIALYVQAGGGTEKWNDEDKKRLLILLSEKAVGLDSSYASGFAVHGTLNRMLSKLAWRK